MAGNYALQDPDGKNYLIEGIVQIGRDRLNHVHLRDPMISRLHATAWVDGEKVFLQDEGSSNGTYVNKMPVGQPVALQVGDQVQMGHTTLILVDTRAGWIHEAPSPVPVKPAPPPPLTQKSNRGFRLAMIGLAGLAILACAIIAAVVLGFINDLRFAPQSPEKRGASLPSSADTVLPQHLAIYHSVAAANQEGYLPANESSGLPITWTAAFAVTVARSAAPEPAPARGQVAGLRWDNPYIEMFERGEAHEAPQKLFLGRLMHLNNHRKPGSVQRFAQQFGGVFHIEGRHLTNRYDVS